MRIVRVLGTVVLWLLQILMAVAFVVIGVAKFADPSWARSFARWGYPDGFYMVIGALEAAGGLALLVPRLTSYVAALLGVISCGRSPRHWSPGSAPGFRSPARGGACLSRSTCRLESPWAG